MRSAAPFDQLSRRGGPQSLVSVVKSPRELRNFVAEANFLGLPAIKPGECHALRPRYSKAKFSRFHARSAIGHEAVKANGFDQHTRFPVDSRCDWVSGVATLRKARIGDKPWERTERYII